MERFVTPAGVQVSYVVEGRGPPLVLVHGSFSDHVTNWAFVKPLLVPHFTVVAMARRGRGETAATQGHEVTDEAEDVIALVERLGGPAFLLGHSYGAVTALAAAPRIAHHVRKLVLYEPAWPRIMQGGVLSRLEALGREGRWDEMAVTFFRDSLFVPQRDLDELRSTPLWPPIVADAPATLRDLAALARHDLDPRRCAGLRIPVLLQVGSESRHELYATQALAQSLPDVRIGTLQGQAHEGMTTAPALYVEALRAFLG